MNIAILDDYQDQVRHLECFRLLKDHDVRVLNETYVNPQELAKHLDGVEVLVLIRERTQITEDLLKCLPNLTLISQTGKISNHIDPALCQRYGVAIAEGVGSPIAPAELCWALMMNAYRHITPYVMQLKAGFWQQSGTLGLGRTLNGQTLGIWGYGKIGQRIAQFGKAFGMQVLIWGRDASREKAVADGFQAAQSKAEFFASADIISLHLRLNDATRYCVTANDLSLMKSDALIVNTSRAELMEPGALFKALTDVPTRTAALDVYETEPASLETEPLIGLPNVLASPHLGYVEQHSYELYFRVAFENVVAFAKGEPQNLIDNIS